MKSNVTRLSICPRCGKPFTEAPALSRLDNESLICPDCGTREALDIISKKATGAAVPGFIEMGRQHDDSLFGGGRHGVCLVVIFLQIDVYKRQ